jgi:hypothetical protein
MNARSIIAIGLAAAAWAGAHDHASRENREDRDHGPSRVVVEARPEHRGFEHARFFRVEDRREAWRRDEWRRDRFVEHRQPVVVVEACHRTEPVRVVVADPVPVRGTISINW